MSLISDTENLSWFDGATRNAKSFYWSTPEQLKGVDLSDAVIFIYVRDYSDSHWLGYALPYGIEQNKAITDDDPRYTANYVIKGHPGQHGTHLLRANDEVLVIVESEIYVERLKELLASGDYRPDRHTDTDTPSTWDDWDS